MRSGPIRRSQLIVPFGVGAMHVDRNGVSLITAGLDHWFEKEDGSGEIDIEEFDIYEWRLQRLLNVNRFRTPPDFRERRPGQNVPNAGMTVPFLRFPTWHHCSWCDLLLQGTLTLSDLFECPECKEKGKRRFLFQVPFVAMCDRGHIQDFPWPEWVHKSVNPQCKGPLRLTATGGASLAGQQLKCDKCGEKRNLAHIMDATDGGKRTYLTAQLDKDGIEYHCRGLRPWLGTEETSHCDRPLRASLRSASNVYFANVRSSIYLPRGSKSAPSELIALFEKHPMVSYINWAVELGVKDEVRPEHLISKYPDLLKPYSNKQIGAALRMALFGEQRDVEEESVIPEDKDPDVTFRRAEFKALRSVKNETELVIKEEKIANYGAELPRFFSSIMLIHKLRETRAFAGFSRVFAAFPSAANEVFPMLWRNPPAPKYGWLPAYKVYGEGIFLQFREERIRQWEQRQTVEIDRRLKQLINHFDKLQKERHLHPREIGPRFVLIHTFAHLLINRLVFECGYSSASLRERLYVSPNPQFPMAGLLIYTSAGDAEGTMGGLVRMGKPGNLEQVVRRSLEGATWCSADPVCMEIGVQGPDSCNLAACHSCALVPETACEEFNRFLDRGLVVGTPENEALGYFSSE